MTSKKKTKSIKLSRKKVFSIDKKNHLKNNRKKDVEYIDRSVVYTTKKLYVKNLIKVIKRAHKKNKKKLVILNSIDYQEHTEYDVAETMEKINNNEIKKLLIKRTNLVGDFRYNNVYKL